MTLKVKQHLYIYILTALFVLLIGRFTAHAKLVDGVKRYRIYLVRTGAQLHNMNLENYCLDIWSISEPWVIEKYGDGYSIRGTSGSQPYVKNGGKYNNLGSTPDKLYLVPSGDYYYIQNANGKNLYADLSEYRLYYRSGGDLWNIVPEHTHNSSGVEYTKNNGSVHNKYTYCNGHGSDHSQNRKSSTESHSYGSWSGWSNYSTSQQRRQRSCSKCGYIEYGYQARPYTITYNGNNGSITKTSETLNYGSTLGTLPTGSRTGYTLKGFFTAASDGSQISASTAVSGDAAYYAQWTPRNDTKYKVEHYLMDMDGIGYTLKDTDDLEGTTDTSVTPDVNTYYGFTAPDKQTVNVDPDGSRLVRYEYTRNKYTAVFDGNNGTTDEDERTLYYENELGTLPGAARIGYDFDGWFTAETGGEQITENTVLLSDTTYYAHWTPRDDTKYRVEHYLMDVDGNGYTLKDTDNLEGTSDTSVTPDVNTYVGFTSPETLTVNVDPDGSRVVRYEYTRNKYVFTLGSDVGVSTEGSTETGSYYYGTEITLKASTLDGYQWDRWTNKDTEMETSVIMPAEDLSIAPEVHPITYTITYILNGGKVDYKKKTYNVETPTFYIENPRKKGYNFTGWTGTGIETADTDLSVPVGSFGDKTFEATWGEDIYSVSFDGNGETSGSMETLTVKPGEGIELPENGFVRDGYSFVGWYTTKQDRFGTFYKNASTVSDLTESVTLHAQWKKEKTPAVPGENGSNGTGNTGDNGNGTGAGNGSSTGDSGTNGNGSASTGDNGNGDNGNGSGKNEPVVTPKDEIGYFGTAFIRNEISIRTTLGMNDKSLTLNYNY